MRIILQILLLNIRQKMFKRDQYNEKMIRNQKFRNNLMWSFNNWHAYCLILDQ